MSTRYIHIKAILLVVFSICSIILSSEIFDSNLSSVFLGSKNSFLLNTLFLIVISQLILRAVKNKYVIKSQITRFHFQNFALFYLGITTLFFIHFFDLGDSLIWPSVSEYPAIMRYADENFNIHDFYTNQTVDSPKIIYYYFFSIFEIFSIDWFLAINFISVCILFGMPWINYLIFHKLTNMMNEKFELQLNNSHIFIIAFVFSLPAMNFLGNGGGAPLGWEMIETRKMADPMLLSFFLGLFSIYFILDEKIFYSVGFLLLATLFHPIVGMFLLSVMIFFEIILANISKRKLRLNFIIFKIFIVFIISSILYLFFFLDSNITSEEFTNQYSNIRHPHHYKFIEIIGIGTLLWLLLFFICFMFSIKLKLRLLKIASILVIGFIFITALIHFIGSDLLQIKAISALGLTRFSSFYLWLLKLNIIIILPFLISKQIKKQKKIITSEETKSTDTKKFTSYFISISFIIIGILSVYKPLDTLPSSKEKEILIWIKNNTTESDQIMPIKFDPYLIRLISERPVYADESFPFKESAMDEFTSRLLFSRKIENRLEDVCSYHNERIKFYITPLQKIGKDFRELYKNDKWMILIKEKNSC